MPLNDQEKERVRYHLGYLGVQGAASIQFGIPRPLQPVFLVEQAMNNLIEATVPRVRRVLRIMDDTETRLEEAQIRLAAKKLDYLHVQITIFGFNGLDMNELLIFIRLPDVHPPIRKITAQNEPDMLEREYVRWGWRLADIFGVPIYPYSNRYRMASGTRAGSIPVR